MLQISNPLRLSKFFFLFIFQYCCNRSICSLAPSGRSLGEGRALRIVEILAGASVPLHGFLILHVVLEAHVPSEIGASAEGRVAESAGRLISVDLEVLGQRRKMLVDAAAQIARKSSRTLSRQLSALTVGFSSSSYHCCNRCNTPTPSLKVS